VKVQFIKYLTFGGIGFITDYAIFYIMIEDGINYQIANAVGYLSGTIVSFLLNRRLTFKVTDRVFSRFSLFAGVAILGYILSSFLLLVFVEYFDIYAKYSKLILLPIVAVFQFTINRNITFSK